MSDQRMMDRYRHYLLRRRTLSGDVLYRSVRPIDSRASDPAVPAQPDRAVRSPHDRGAAPLSDRSVPRAPERAVDPQPPRPVPRSVDQAIAQPSDPPLQRTESSSGTIRIGSAKEQADLFSAPGEGVTGGEFSDLDLSDLEELVAACTRCPLCEGRTRSVFGTGDPKAKIVFIGEAPGREEDLQGKPFVGRAGQLLTKILAAVGFTREAVYIANVLKCRPPENRDPKEEEVKACKPYLKRQIELISPVLIVALGRVAGQNLLETTASLSALRKSIHYYEDVKTVVTYHPAALLRNPNLKRPAWEDIQEVRRMYDEALEGI